MPRKGPATKRSSSRLYVPTVTALSNKVLRSGKRSLAERIVYGALEGAKEKTATTGGDAEACSGQREADPGGSPRGRCGIEPAR